MKLVCLALHLITLFLSDHVKLSSNGTAWMGDRLEVVSFFAVEFCLPKLQPKSTEPYHADKHSPHLEGSKDAGDLHYFHLVGHLAGLHHGHQTHDPVQLDELQGEGVVPGELGQLIDGGSPLLQVLGADFAKGLLGLYGQGVRD